MIACQENSQNIKGNELTQSDILNNEAMQLLQKAADTPTLVQALYILDKAVTLDSTNYAAYNNMMSILLQLKKMDKAIVVLDHLINATHIPNYSLFKGFITERHYNDSVAAFGYYVDAYHVLDSLVASGIKDDEMQINRMLALFMAYGQDSTLPVLDSLQLSINNHNSIENLKSAIINNDRNAILNEAY